MASENTCTLIGWKGVPSEEVLKAAMEEKFKRTIVNVIKIDANRVDFEFSPISNRSYTSESNIHENYCLNLIDTPGRIDFVIETAI